MNNKNKDSKQRGVDVFEYRMIDGSKTTEAKWTNEMKRVHDSLSVHPIQYARGRWNEIGIVHSALVTNSRYLIACLEMPNNVEGMQAEIIRTVNDNGMRVAYARELYRHFHNYLASVTTLVGRARGIMKAYKGSDVAREYLLRVDTIIDSGVAQCLQELRNYLLHEAVPKIHYDLEYDTKDMRIKVLVSDIVNSKRGVNGVAKSYMKHEYVIIKDAVEEYGIILNELYTWLFSQFDILHKHDIVNFNELVLQQRALVGKAPMGLEWSEFDGPTPSKIAESSKSLFYLFHSRLKDIQDLAPEQTLGESVSNHSVESESSLISCSGVSNLNSILEQLVMLSGYSGDAKEYVIANTSSIMADENGDMFEVFRIESIFRDDLGGVVRRELNLELRGAVGTVLIKRIDGSISNDYQGKLINGMRLNAPGEKSLSGIMVDSIIAWSPFPFHGSATTRLNDGRRIHYRDLQSKNTKIAFGGESNIKSAQGIFNEMKPIYSRCFS